MRGPGSRSLGATGMRAVALRARAVVFVGLFALLVAPATAQQRGGVLQIANRASPASMSPLEEATISTIAPMMAVFNNLVLFDQHVPQNSLNSIVPDLAESWTWSEDGTRLTFHLHRGVRWHDDKPFT